MNPWGWMALAAGLLATAVALLASRPQRPRVKLPHMSRDGLTYASAACLLAVSTVAMFTGDDGTTSTALAVGGMLLIGLIYLGPRLKSFKIKDIEIVLQDLAQQAVLAEGDGNDEVAQQLRDEIARLVTLLTKPESQPTGRRSLAYGANEAVAAEAQVADLLRRAAPSGSEIWRNWGGGARAASDFGVVRHGMVVAVEVRLGLNFQPEKLANVLKATAVAAGGQEDLDLRGGVLFVPSGQVNTVSRIQVGLQHLLSLPVRILEITDENEDELREVLAAMLG